MNILVDGQTLESAEIKRGIGVYFKNVLSYMMKRSYIHQWYITVSDPKALKHLDPWVAKRLIPVTDPIFQPSTDYTRTPSYTNKLNQTIKQYDIDIYWNPNPMMVNVLFPLKRLECQMYLTIHDLIPAVMPVKEWEKRVQNEYQRRVQMLSDEGICLICVSDATRQDVVRYTGRKQQMRITLEAADSKRFYTKRENGGLHQKPTIVFTGGFDYRKNMYGALEAFAYAVKTAPESHPIHRSTFYFVCHAQSNTEATFYERATQLGVREQIQLTGFISDEALKALYANCDIFFFPSLYEGFGLPIVEAMLGGAYIVSADNSSLPEVCGSRALLCNAQDKKNMAEQLLKAFECASQETAQDKQTRQEYALGFSWEKTAAQTLQYFESSLSVPTGKKRMALITPWPKQQTGIANYVYKMVPYWAKHFEVDVFADQTIVDDVEFLDNPYGQLYPIKELDEKHQNYDVLLYQIGNSSEFHTGVYQYLRKYPGVAEIHDYVLHPFFYHSFFLKRQYQEYQDALVRGYGRKGQEHYQAVRDKVQHPDNIQFPMAHSVAQIATKVIFHNHWSAEQIQQECVHVIPLASFDYEPMEQGLDEIRRIKRKIGLENGEILLSLFGFVNQNKRPEIILEVVKCLRDKGYPIRLVCWGKSNMDSLDAIIAEKGLRGCTTVTGFIDEVSYEIGLELSDLVINLRYPSMGESSATLCEAFKHGKAVIVSDLNQYTEFPDEVCWKIPVGHGEVDCLTQMLEYLIEHPEVRQALGENAKAYADYVLAPARIAEEYKRILVED